MLHSVTFMLRPGNTGKLERLNACLTLIVALASTLVSARSRSEAGLTLRLETKRVSYLDVSAAALVIRG